MRILKRHHSETHQNGSLKLPPQRFEICSIEVNHQINQFGQELTKAKHTVQRASIDDTGRTERSCRPTNFSNHLTKIGTHKLIKLIFCIISISISVLFSFGVQIRKSQANTIYDGWTFFMGSELYTLCKSGNPLNQRSCAMYICGMIDGWSAESIVNRGNKTYKICLPKGTTCDQLVAAVVKHLENNPESQKSAGGGAVGYGLHLAYPCD
jgi:hypothetical protein